MYTHSIVPDVILRGLYPCSKGKYTGTILALFSIYNQNYTITTHWQARYNLDCQLITGPFLQT